MGFLSKFEKQVPSTADNPEAITATAQLSNEKSYTNQNESGNESTTVANGFQVTPEMERKLVRKLDTRLVLLVMGLCMQSRTLSNSNSNFYPQIFFHIWIDPALGMELHFLPKD